MTCRISFLMACLLVACSADIGVPSDPGAYLKRIGDTEAQLVVVTETKQSVTIQGTFNNDSAIPPVLGRIAPASVSGQYTVTTPNCGTLHFVEGKGVGLFCQECEIMNISRNAYAKCELTKFNIPPFWSPIGI